MAKVDASMIEMMPKQSKDPLFEQIENDKHHTPYESETALYNCIENGDIDGLENILKKIMENRVTVGRMSNNDLKQMQYFAVCCIALATRSAIKGGVSEVTAFNLSDEYIQTVDAITDIGEIPKFIFEKAYEITALVRESKGCAAYGEIVRKAVYYIETHLYQKLTPGEVAQFCAVSKDYLNVLFKRDTGKTTGAFIRGAKLRESRRLINRGLTNSQIAYQLCFSSESYFVVCYKKEFGITPGKEMQKI